jgi:hypothetical protein
MLDLLPSAFTLADARDAGLRKDQVYGLLATGSIERVARGAFVKPVSPGGIGVVGSS